MAAQGEPVLLGHCPHLGLLTDRGSIFSEPTEDHRCYATKRPQPVDFQHQQTFCLSDRCVACPLYVPVAPTAPAPRPTSAAPVLTPADDLPQPKRGLGGWFERASKAQIALLTGALVLGVGALLFLAMNRVRPASSALAVGVAPGAAPVVLAVTPTLALTLAPAATPSPTPNLQLVADRSTPVLLPTPTLLPGQLMASLIPTGNGVGWVASGDRVNHFGDRNLHAGVFEGQTYLGALQFPLASIPVGSKIEYAAVELMGLNSENLGSDGQWNLRLLDPTADTNWATTTYERIRDAQVTDTIGVPLKPSDLGARQTNVFVFSDAQLGLLEQRLENRLASFRVEGPTEGTKDLFTWDTGYGGGFGTRPVLRVIYQVPPTLTPIIITVTPQPANLATAVAQIAQATYQAREFGTPTPFPTNVVTAPPPLVVTNTPTPENAATAEFVRIEAQARAQLFGTPTPLPQGMEIHTATPIPTPGPTRTLRPVIPTSTITPTPVPLLIPVETLNIRTFTPTPPPTSTPDTVPDTLRGKILFMSDRLNGKDAVFVMSPDGSDLALVTDAWVYRLAQTLDQFSPDRSFRVFVRPGFAEQRFTVKGVTTKGNVANMEVWMERQSDGDHKVLTTGPRVTYDPAWSPDGVHVVFVSQESGNDEIYTLDLDTRHEQRLTDNDWVWDKHPTYSPDGKQIVFWSNRDGRKGLYIMNADGSDQRRLIDSPYNDWDPIWIK